MIQTNVQIQINEKSHISQNSIYFNSWIYGFSFDVLFSGCLLLHFTRHHKNVAHNCSRLPLQKEIHIKNLYEPKYRISQLFFLFLLSIFQIKEVHIKEITFEQ